MRAGSPGEEVTLASELTGERCPSESAPGVLGGGRGSEGAETHATAFGNGSPHCPCLAVCDLGLVLSDVLSTPVLSLSEMLSTPGLSLSYSRGST